MADGWEEIGPGVLVAYRRMADRFMSDRWWRGSFYGGAAWQHDRLHVFQSGRERPSNVCRPCKEEVGDRGRFDA